MRIGPVNAIVLLGGGEILRSLAAWAIHSGVDLKVITSPRHASEISKGDSLSEYLSRKNVKYLVTEDIDSDEVEKFLTGNADSFFLSLGAAWIFRQSTIESVFQNRLLNCHGTRLPNNRGGGGFSWQIMMGSRFGISLLHKIDAGIDTGPIVAYEEFIYQGSLRTPIEFESKYIENTVKFIVDLISESLIKEVTLKEIEQNEYLSSYWPRLDAEVNGWIDWGLSAIELERFICAFDDPYRGAHTELNGKKIYLKKVCLSPSDGFFHSFQAGIVYRVSKSWICVAIPGSTLLIQEVKDENGLDILEKIKVGDRLITPANKLHESLQKIVYTPIGIKSIK
jgi:methionyl-tRNA formyltransferase